MEDSIELDRLHQREDSLTVVRGCLATVLTHWDRLNVSERHELLRIAHDKTECLIGLYAEEVAALHL